MLKRVLAAAVVAALVVFALLAWRQNSSRVEEAGTPAASAPMGDASAPMGDASAPAGEAPAPGMSMSSPHADNGLGVDWVVPCSWVNQVGSGMRFATYAVPGADTNGDAECAVYYFGPGQGGGVEANLDRWSGEFEKIARQDNKRREINGLKVATIALTGTFGGHAMQPGEAAGPKPSWGMLGAIVTGPKGDVFFKLTGPATTIDKAKPAFEEMLSSMHTH